MKIIPALMLTICFSLTAGARDVAEIELLSSIENSFSSLKQTEFYLQEAGSPASVCVHVGALAHAQNRLVQSWTSFANEHMSQALLNQTILETLPVNKKTIDEAALICTKGFDLKAIQKLIRSVRERQDRFVEVLDQKYGIQRNRVVPASAVIIK